MTTTTAAREIVWSIAPVRELSRLDGYKPVAALCACKHCGLEIERDGSRWVHEESGWGMCDATARTFAEPR